MHFAHSCITNQIYTIHIYAPRGIATRQSYNLQPTNNPFRIDNNQFRQTQTQTNLNKQQGWTNDHIHYVLGISPYICIYHISIIDAVMPTVDCRSHIYLPYKLTTKFTFKLLCGHNSFDHIQTNNTTGSYWCCTKCSVRYRSYTIYVGPSIVVVAGAKSAFMTVNKEHNTNTQNTTQ